MELTDLPPFDDLRTRSLDDWYKTVNGIYLDRNFHKSQELLFAHLVEVVGGLSLLASGKTKPGITPSSYVPKAIAWWLAVCGKVGVKSVADMVWWKYPGVCPYCRLTPHNSLACKRNKDALEGPDWGALSQIGQEKADDRPQSLDEWLNMFQGIYPASNTESFAPIFARFAEEMGELAESLRIFAISPGSFLSEAADVFAWLMHLQNLLRVQGMSDDATLNGDMVAAYGRGCIDCQNPVCTCPPILPSTLNRISHEAPHSRKSFSASMMTVDEAMAHFSLTTRVIRAGAETVEATDAVLQEINQGVGQLIYLTLGMKEGVTTQTKIMMDALYQVNGLTSAHRITQESLDELARAIAKLEPEARSNVMDFLQGVTEGVWASVLLELVKKSFGG